MFGVAGYFLLLASIIFTIALGYGLVALGLAPWLSFVIIGVVLILVAAVLALLGKKRISKVGPPEKTISSVKQTIEAVKPSRP